MVWLLSYAVDVSARGSTSLDEAQLDDLLSLLDKETELATKSGMNADFIPGMATILVGDDLLARGVQTVWGALSLVPGVSLALELTGERQVLSRGVGHGYASGNVKILLDGVSMNSTLHATANPVLNIPIEQVERVEVIRGPGSSVYGEYAFAGVINVITRRRQRTAQLMLGEGGESGAGGVWYWTDPERDLVFSVNVAGIDADGVDVQVERDALYGTGREDLSNAPGPINNALRYRGLFADLQWGDRFAAIKVLDDATGDYFGINHFLPPSDGNLAARQRYVSIELGQDLRWSESLSARIRFEGLRHERDRHRLYVFPAGYAADDRVYMNQDYQETRYLGAADLHWSPVANHQLLFGLEASQVEVDQASWEWVNLPFELDSDWLDTGRNRRILGAIAQDQYRVSERVTITGTLRYDDYSDFGSFLSPRVAAVWRIDDEHILKMQYARAFRPPTFYELEYASKGSIDAGEISTYELGYILKQPSWEGRLIVFLSDLTDPILFDDVELNGYVNSADARLQGVEIEYQHRFGASFKIDANASYVDARRRSNGQSLAGGADLLGNLALLWRPAPDWTAAVQLRYVGPRHRAESDWRDDVDASTQLDLTLSYRSPGRGPFAYVGIKNLTDTDVRYPDQLTSYDGVDLIYPDGYPTPGRRWWLTVGYAF